MVLNEDQERVKIQLSDGTEISVQFNEHDECSWHFYHDGEAGHLFWSQVHDRFGR